MEPFIDHRRSLLQRVALVSAAATLAGTACGATSTRGTATATCPTKSPSGYLADDVSESARSAAVRTERRQATETFLTQIASCGGRAKVVAFTSSAAATRTLLDQDRLTGGATAISRQRRVPKLVKAMMTTVDAQLKQALAGLPGDGTDIVAQLQLAAEYHTQTGGDHPLVVEILSDGLSTVGIDLNQPTLTTDRATAAAGGITLPTLSGAKVTFGGIGKMAGPLPPTSFVDALKAFYSEACRRTQADCRVVTDVIVGMAA